MAEHTFIELSKLDVIKRELDFAIRLFFCFGDVVVIHLVSSTCKDMLYDLADKSEINTFKKEMKKLIKPDKWDYFQRKLRESYTFMKHADKDSDKLLRFNPESSEFEILDAINVYQSLTKEITGLMMSFRGWFYLKYPGVLVKTEQIDAFTSLKKQIDISDRNLFIKLAQELETRRTKGAI